MDIHCKFCGEPWEHDTLHVGHPSSSSLKLFGGERAMELAEGTKDREALTPDWETGRPYDWTALLDFIIAHARKKEHDP
jgi:hypothetical protein